MIPDVNLGSCCCKGVAAPVMVDSSKCTFATELKNRSLRLKQRSCLAWSKWNLPQLHCTVCAARHAGVSILCDADPLDLCCVAKQLAQRSLSSNIPDPVSNSHLALSQSGAQSTLQLTHLSSPSAHPARSELSRRGFLDKQVMPSSCGRDARKGLAKTLSSLAALRALVYSTAFSNGCRLGSKFL